MRPRRDPPSSGDVRAQLAAAPSFFLLFLAFITPAAALDLSRDAGAWTLSAEADADVLLALPDTGETDQSALADLLLRTEAERFFQSGLRAGIELDVGWRRDNGREGVGLQGPVGGAFTGRVFSAADPAGPRGDLTTAGVFVRGGWGELRAGRGAGAADRDASSPALPFRLLRADGGLVDPSGRNVVRTRNMLTGRAAKISIRSQRLFGLRAGVSYTPEPDACGLDACAPQGQAFEHGIEAAFSFEHLFRGPDLRVEASVEAAAAQRADTLAVIGGLTAEDPWARSGRLALSRGAWSLGAAALVSNDGLSGGAYTAVSGFLSREAGDWLAALEAGAADSDLSGEESRVVQFGASRLIGDHWVAGGALSWSAREDAAGAKSDGLQGVLEIGLRF